MGKSLVRRYTAADQEFWRRFLFCEEDRARFTSERWKGGYRWFRSANVLPIEQYTRREADRSDRTAA
jgi:hypothetical protein